MSIETGDLVPRIYSNFRGADFRGEEINLRRSPDCLNVWKDYKETESIRTRPAMELNLGFDDTVYGVYFYNGEMIVHSGTKLYKVAQSENDKLPFKDGSATVLRDNVNAGVSNAFIFENVWYFKDGVNYLEYDGNTISDVGTKTHNYGSTDREFFVGGYIPTTTIGRKPEGGGTTYEDVNMLCDFRFNTFLGDGKSKKFYLDVMNIDSDFKPEIRVERATTNADGDIVYITKLITNNIKVNYEEGWVKILHTEDIPPEPLTDGRDNVKIKFKKTVQGYREKILNCTMLQVFDNRVFFSGNEDYPNTVWHCSLNDPSYVSDLDYYFDGMDRSPIRGMVAGNNALWVFREPSEANTNVFYHTPTIDDQYGKIYPSSHSSIALGCVGKAINFNDDIVFFSARGMEGISGDITTEQVAAHRSSLVDRKLIADDNYKNMILEEWEGYLLIFVGDKVFLADSRTAFTNENHIEYDFFYWELSHTITCTRVHDGVLYLGTEDGIYTLTDMTADIESYWVTPKDKFKAPQKLKTTNKRGCVVEATGDISVYAKTEDTDFELIGTYEGIKDYFACRIKRKKFKDLQLKFYSNTRFSLETATLECFIGGYIKR